MSSGRRSRREGDIRAPVALGRPVLPPIPPPAELTRYQGTPNPSYTHGEDTHRGETPHGKYVTSGVRRELPKTPDQTEGARPGGRRSRYDTHLTVHDTTRSRSQNGHAQSERNSVSGQGSLSRLPDVTFSPQRQAASDGGRMSPAPSRGSGSRSPRVGSRSSGSRSAEPEAPLIKTNPRRPEATKNSSFPDQVKRQTSHRSNHRASFYMENRHDISPGDDSVFVTPDAYREQNTGKRKSKSASNNTIKGGRFPEQPFNLVCRTDSTLHVVFDVYTHNPMEVPVPAGSGYDEGPYLGVVRECRKNEQFIEGLLLRSVTSDSPYPYILYMVFKEGASVRPAPPPSPPTPLEGEDNTSYPTTVTAGSTAGSAASSTDTLDLLEIINSQGGYREMHSFLDRQRPVFPRFPRNQTTAFLISAFKTLERQDTRDLDETWSTWSGADYIVENAPSVLGLERVSFHKVKYNNGVDTFHYILMCELTAAVTKMSRALSFIESLKLRQCGYCNLYIVEHTF